MPVLQFRIKNYELRVIFNTSVVIFNNCHAFFVFTYQIEKMHFGMYTGLPRRPERAPRNESHASACLPSFALQNSRFIDCFVAELLVMTVQNFLGDFKGLAP